MYHIMCVTVGCSIACHYVSQYVCNGWMLFCIPLCAIYVCNGWIFQTIMYHIMCATVEALLHTIMCYIMCVIVGCFIAYHYHIRNSPLIKRDGLNYMERNMYLIPRAYCREPSMATTHCTKVTYPRSTSSSYTYTPPRPAPCPIATPMDPQQCPWQ